MAKSFAIAALVATALCFSSLLISANAKKSDTLFVEGRVYCDTCRVEFQTKLSEPLGGVKVRLECNSRENGTLTFSEEGVTDKGGSYTLSVRGDHEEDICQIKLLSSPRADCNEQFQSTDMARILITRNVGVAEPKRYANALGFKIKTALPECDKVLTDMGFLPLEIMK
ncbi:hypothetical protein Tsubulata_032190 [Turnera subulata]|uniref:Uncharacterized protein n=1 Tax=Turnera subulata TaxID=218843 RepID=A0A9Q0F0W9_9ROSI|nr:hypothetical protein Tsubulata_032190 [Turnera subulata]